MEVGVRIGRLSELTGASVRSLRYYGETGLLEVRRGPGGHRLYDSADVAQVHLIQALLSVGLSTREIGEIKQHCKKMPHQKESQATAMLHKQRDIVDSCIHKLVGARSRLDSFIAEAEARDRVS
ncbi:MerR family transcriptional regulator [Streptomyces sp. PU-14G]|uniref:MerR family transcriptional regulator n=1 Tax=Streptomyces sp. PU-14G TaxID=2800808 RepID=UPI0034DEF3BD